MIGCAPHDASSSGQLGNRCLLLLVSLILLTACQLQPASRTPTANIKPVHVTTVGGEPVENILPKLHPQAREHLEMFMATYPITVSPMGFPSTVLVNPLTSDGTQAIVQSSQGRTTVPVLFANLRLNHSPRRILCLHNAAQIPCSPQADIWRFEAEPTTGMIVTATFTTSPGDRLAFLVISENEAQRPFPVAHDRIAYVDHRPPPPAAPLDAPEHRALFGGCDFLALIRDPEDSTPNNFNLHHGIPAGQPMYLLIQLCNPTGREIIQLVPIADSSRVFEIDDPFWRQPIRLKGKATLLKINPAWLEGIQQVQIYAMPMSQEAQMTLRHRFTQAVRLLPENGGSTK